ncbi:hypothetical protein ACFT30_04045 [Microbacterium ureisolvens]|uniref:hypothetical protein n=1 Tax=Microbacterium ureisolvens TaxID=2781186 RepID=UPI00362E2389
MSLSMPLSGSETVSLRTDSDVFAPDFTGSRGRLRPFDLSSVDAQYFVGSSTGGLVDWVDALR